MTTVKETMNKKDLIPNDYDEVLELMRDALIYMRKYNAKCHSHRPYRVYQCAVILKILEDERP